MKKFIVSAAIVVGLIGIAIVPIPKLGAQNNPPIPFAPQIQVVLGFLLVLFVIMGACFIM